MRFIILLVLCLNGCISNSVQEAIDAADEHARLKWSEEWKPALIAEMRSTVDQAKESIAIEIDGKLLEYRGKLDTIGVKVEDHDTNQDGRMQVGETLALLRDIKAKNDRAPQPLSWWEIIAAVGAAYLPLTGAKEMTMKAMKPKAISAK